VVSAAEMRVKNAVKQFTGICLCGVNRKTHLTEYDWETEKIARCGTRNWRFNINLNYNVSVL